MLEDGTAEITKYNGNASVLTIPSEFGNIKVSSIGAGAFSGCQKLTKIQISQCISSVASGAFLNCSSVTQVTLPETITFIGSLAFNTNSSFTINIPDSVTEIESNPFGEYTYPSILLSKDHPYLQHDGVCTYYTKPDMRLVWACRPPQDYSIPDGILIIGNEALAGQHFTSITIPESVTIIGDDAFVACHGLTSIDIPGSVKTIGKHAFTSCGFIKTITLHDGLVSIGDSAFAGNENLLSINIPASVESIGEKMLQITTGFDRYVVKPYQCIVTVARNSYGEQYCKAHYINYRYEAQ